MSLISYDSIEEAIRECFGENVEIERSAAGSHGDINSTKVLSLSNGTEVFLKVNSVGNKDFFDTEEEGLSAIAKTGTIKTPELFAKGIDRNRNIAFLMMEVINRGRFSPDAMYELGSRFADMHMADASQFVPGGRYGFTRDNYIGATKQINTPKDSWIEFFRSCRLEPQIRMAESDLSKQDIRDALRLLDRLGDFLSEPEKPSLLHGDMWGGNHLIDEEGTPVLIDPAVYVGHSETDIAMTELFSPFSPAFYKGYYEKLPMREGYSDRRELYNLYHVLNHHNLFGGGYLYSAVATIRRYV